MTARDSKAPVQGLGALDERKLPTLVGQRVSLRWMTRKDAGALYEIFSHPEVVRYWSTGPMQRKSDALLLLQDIREEHAAGRLHEWGLTTGEADRIIGTCTLFALDRSNRRAEVGFALAREWWGRGLMRDGLATLLDFAFETLGLRRIEADVDPRNRLSAELLERLGFKREGTMRERWNVGGEVQDAAIYGLLAREYSPGVR
jgi:[ribosomal protein S5]-alanine N-acetyltransferase